MADSTSTLSISNDASTVADSSCFRRTVCLYDWWLIKAESDFEGKWLAVSGITSEKEKAIRVFVSAPVAKRYDMLSLETTDGIYVMIRGFINEQRTLENGFPAEVFNNFMFGFPPNWESFVVDWFRHEASTGFDLGSAVPEKVSPIDSEVLSDGVEQSIPISLKSLEEALGAHERSFPTEECHACKETTGGDNVALGSGSNRHSMRLHNVKVCQQKKPSSEVAHKHPGKQQHPPSSGALENPDGEGLESLMATVQSQSPRQVNTLSNKLIKNSSSAIDQKVLFDEKSIPTSSKSPKEFLGAHKKPFPTEECHASKETMDGDNAALVSGSNRRSMRLHNIKVSLVKKPAFEVAWKHPSKEQHSSSGALENPDGEGLESLTEPVQSQSLRQVNTPSNKLIKSSSLAIDPKVLFDENSISTCLKSPEEALGAHERAFPTEECHASKETTSGGNVALGSGSNRRSLRLHNVKVCQQKKPASEVAHKHPGKERHSSSGALENPDGEGLESLMAPVVSQSPREVNTPSNKLYKNSSSAIDSKVLFDGVAKSIPTSSKSPQQAMGANKKPFPTEECHASKETTGGVNVALGSGSKRRSKRLHNIKVCQLKKPASEVARKHPGEEQHASSGSLEILDGEGLKSPMTPVQSQSPAQVNTQSRKLLKNSASRVSRPFSAKDEGSSKKQKVTVETKVITPKRKRARSASAVKYTQERDVNPLIKGGKEKISSVSPLSSSFRKSRSGRLLLPPLEFWRNQIAIYNADHEVTEIQEGASVVSPFKGSLPSLSRFSNQKRAA